MAKSYVWVRIRKDDFNRIIQTKKLPIEKDLMRLTGKEIKIKNTQLFNIASNSTWDLGTDFQNKIIGAIRIKKKDLKL